MVSFDLRGSRHLSAFRMTHPQLLHLVSFFSDDIAFVSTVNKPQAPPLYQIGITVYRLAHGNDVRSIARTFGVSGESAVYAFPSPLLPSAGAVEAWTWRTLRAMLRKKDRFIYWPSGLEREGIKASFLSAYGIPDCTGIVDGHHVNLAFRPSPDDAGVFHSRKERYGFIVAGIVDHTKRIRYLHYGYPASSSDMRVQRAIEPLNDPGNHFANMEYILADSGYAASHHVVPMFKKSAGNATLRGRKAYFNIHAARMRVQVEQTFGIMKQRWQILRAVPQRLKTKKDQARAHAMIVACAMLHNLVVDTYVGRYDDEDNEDEGDGEGEQNVGDGLRIPENQRRREALVDQMLAINHENDIDEYELWYVFQTFPASYLASASANAWFQVTSLSTCILATASSLVILSLSFLLSRARS